MQRLDVDQWVRPQRVARALSLLAIVCGCLGSARASAQVKPYFLVIVDTSGSMAWCSGGSTSSLGTNDCSCHESNNCGAAFRTNRCGFAANRLGDAKCSLQRIIDGVGDDAVFALMQFEHPCTSDCSDTSAGSGSSCTSGGSSYDDGELLTTFDTSSPGNANVRQWVDGACTGTCSNNYTRELAAGQWTPIARSLTRANEFLRGMPGTGFLFPTNGNQAPDSPFASDSQLACRPVSVILLTDGDDNCSSAGAPEAAAAALYGSGDLNASSPSTKAFRTYVIGFGTGGNFNPSVLNQIAASGGTDAPPSGGDRYYPAANEEELSAALADIIADSIQIERCNGLDDDCDNRVDEGLPSGQPGSSAQPDALFCDGEGKRSSAQNDQVRARPDYSDTLAQSSPLTDPVVCGKVDDTCDNPNQDDDCDGAIDEDATNLTACGTCPGQPDVCDGFDNDCDGVVDEEQDTGKPFSVCPVTCTGDVPCGSGVGECEPGHYVCVDGKLDTSVCVGQKGPQPEICDEKDNDCDGIVDNPSTLARACNTPWGETGICVPGTQYCAKPSIGEAADGMGYHVDAMGNPVCIGQVNPQDREICDNLDHDCDGDPLTCTQSTCVQPEPEGVGDPCGQGVGSCKGTQICNTMTSPPTLMCNATGGSDEVCDGQDNDCDGFVDEDLGPQGPCGSSVGECKLGNYECDASGKRQCVGATGPSDEVCDALDNDCDGKVDEDLGVGDACGQSEGLCEPGKLTCQSGRLVCSGGIGPQLETCDCADNDCDGKVDEDSQDNPVCPSGSVCTMCQCALPCGPTQEFVAQCPQGKAAIVQGDSCYCVGERCNDKTCAQQRIEQDGVVQCAPASSDVGSCICRNNECVSRCAGVTCSDGLVCDPTDGRCRKSSCQLPQFKCPDGQRCDLVDDAFTCVDDPCANQQCGADEACRDGTCVKSCGSVHCDSGQRCVDGACEQDRCASVTCSQSDQVCDPATGECVRAGACVHDGCADGHVCDAVSGECREDPCLKIECPAADRCDSGTGQCVSRCKDGLLLCDQRCVDPQFDRQHCGASGDCSADNAGQACGDGLVCSLGECGSTCSDGRIDCDGTCIDPMQDDAHCGASGDCTGSAAGKTCRDTETCTAGVCRSNTQTSAPDQTVHGLVATGGGGCSCSVGPGGDRSSGTTRGPFALAGGLLLVATLLSRRRKTRARGTRAHRTRAHRTRGRILRRGRLALWLLALLGPVQSGCQTDAFCLDCRDDASAGKQTDAAINGRSDAGTNDAGGLIRDAASADASRPDSGHKVDACAAVELCNGIDDDCDGKTDEDVDLDASSVDLQTDSNNCGSCGHVCAIEHAFNACRDGQCVIDRDRGEQGCDIGYHDLDGDPKNGCEYHCARTADDDKICNLVDDDCDGKIDEDIDLKTDPDNCSNCGLHCEFAHAAKGASCVDGTCRLDGSRCDDGFRDVDQKPGTGCEYRCPVNPAVAETCNALDDDCDGKIDEDIHTQDDVRIGVACGSDTGECKPGSTVCVDGAPKCMGNVEPALERCDAKDNDCDGQVDEDFDLQTDSANCGSCGHACLFDATVSDGHATLVCQGGDCHVGACIGNWVDKNGDYHDGCEQTCTVTSEEYCDGIDNDCNGLIDDNVAAPEVVCAARETGVCAASASTLDALHAYGPQCASGTLSCNPANATTARIPGVQADETLCDGLDNDCDGKVDEMIPAIGKPCSKGTGACATTGVNVCDSGPSGYRCGAPDPSSGTPEVCDGKDNDCNGIVDDFGSPIDNAVGGFDVVNLGGALGNVSIMAYEASRPDATDTSAGTKTNKPCSAPNRLPWANVTWGEANAACCALNPDGQCKGDKTGWRLCDASTWQAACRGASGSCAWAYSDLASAPCDHSPSNTNYTKVCLGAEDLVSCPAGVNQCATVTGSSDYDQCYAALSGGDVFDMSGNLKEWTYTQSVAATSDTPASYAIRGGSYDNLESGRSCDFDFTVGSTAFRFPTTGFRCCYYP